MSFNLYFNISLNKGHIPKLKTLFSQMCTFEYTNHRRMQCHIVITLNMYQIKTVIIYLSNEELDDDFLQHLTTLVSWHVGLCDYTIQPLCFK